MGRGGRGKLHWDVSYVLPVFLFRLLGFVFQSLNDHGLHFLFVFHSFLDVEKPSPMEPGKISPPT